MLDLDGFKAFNDACGHPAGDAFLAASPARWRSATRDGDRLYRYGGDEFVAILAGADRSAPTRSPNASGAASSSCRTGPAAARRRSASASPASPTTGGTKDELVEMADRALYLAKPEGRSAPAAVTGRPVPPGARRDRARAARPARPDGAARDDHGPGDRPARHAARVHLPGRARRLVAGQPRHRHVRATSSAAGCRSTRGSPARSSDRRAGRRRRLRRLRRSAPGLDAERHSAPSSACRWRRAARPSGSSGSRRARRPDVRAARDRTPWAASPSSPRSRSTTPGCSRRPSAARSTTPRPASPIASC